MNFYIDSIGYAYMDICMHPDTNGRQTEDSMDTGESNGYVQGPPKEFRAHGI